MSRGFPELPSAVTLLAMEGPDSPPRWKRVPKDWVQTVLKDGESRGMPLVARRRLSKRFVIEHDKILTKLVAEWREANVDRAKPTTFGVSELRSALPVVYPGQRLDDDFITERRDPDLPEYITTGPEMYDGPPLAFKPSTDPPPTTPEVETEDFVPPTPPRIQRPPDAKRDLPKWIYPIHPSNPMWDP